jgi:cation transport regulator ChaC
MATAKPDKQFPRPGMDYEDRFRMTVKKVGREVCIELNRGKATVSPDGKTVTIVYKDAQTRKAKSAV